ncbi:MAG: enoyl-CoA hydratase/isomerase family protein [Acidobacteriaceae bacterium]
MTTQPTILLNEGEDANWIRLNRPAAMNAFDETMLNQWNAALNCIRDRSRPLVITGTGRAFCAGGDLKKYLKRLEDIDGLRRYFDLLEDVFMQIVDFPGPTIAAVNGVAVAGGLEAMCLCDLALAADSARLGDGHINYGMHPGGGSSATLSWLIGERRARWLILTGELISAAEAERIGLVNRVVPDADLESEIAQLARLLRKHSRPAILRTKRLMARDIRSVLRAEKDSILDHFQDPETRLRLEGFARRSELRKSL